MSQSELNKVQGAFKLPFKEQIDFYNQKVAMPSKSYKDISAVQHDKAFVVSGAMKADLIKDLQDAVGKGMSDGESLGQFRNRFSSIVQQRGWTDYTGSDSKAGVAWRTKVIYTTNMRTSHAAGRWHQMRTPEMMAARPYWEYRHVTTHNPRLNHRRLNNTVLPADDGWWSINYPPNGYGCNCYARALSAYDVQRMGLTVDATPDFDAASASFAHAAGSTWRPDYAKYTAVVAQSLINSLIQQGIDPDIDDL